MTFTSDIKIMGDILCVTSKGTLDTVGEAEEYVDLIRREAFNRERKKVLLDERELMDSQDTLDAYDLSESDAARLIALAGIRLSCVCHPDNYALNKTYETLLLNRSLLFKVFLNKEEALEWLGS